MDLFSSEKTTFKLPQAYISYISDFITLDASIILFESLKQDIDWQQDDITVFGKTYKQPRLTALYSETNTPYAYSNITMYPKPFTKDLLELKKKVEDISESAFNSVLLNLYRDGSDSNGWHADNEKELGINPVIASISLGAERTFHFKHRKLPNEKHKIHLENGSLLLMAGEMQHHWLHQIPKTKKPIGARINLTFRRLL